MRRWGGGRGGSARTVEVGVRTRRRLEFFSGGSVTARGGGVG